MSDGSPFLPHEQAMHDPEQGCHHSPAGLTSRALQVRHAGTPAGCGSPASDRRQAYAKAKILTGVLCSVFDHNCLRGNARSFGDLRKNVCFDALRITVAESCPIRHATGHYKEGGKAGLPEASCVSCHSRVEASQGQYGIRLRRRVRKAHVLPCNLQCRLYLGVSPHHAPALAAQAILLRVLAERPAQDHLPSIRALCRTSLSPSNVISNKRTRGKPPARLTVG